MIDDLVFVGRISKIATNRCGRMADGRRFSGQVHAGIADSGGVAGFVPAWRALTGRHGNPRVPPRSARVLGSSEGRCRARWPGAVRKTWPRRCRRGGNDGGPANSRGRGQLPVAVVPVVAGGRLCRLDLIRRGRGRGAVEIVEWLSRPPGTGYGEGGPGPSLCGGTPCGQARSREGCRFTPGPSGPAAPPGASGRTTGARPGNHAVITNRGILEIAGLRQVNPGSDRFIRRLHSSSC